MMLKELLDSQRANTDHFFQTIDLQEVERLLQLLLQCKGVIFFTGVGKSGLVAKKIAFTMVSTGTKAFYLSPMDAVHGDLGMVSSRDVFVMLSKSGESDELLNLIPAIRHKGATIISIVCNPQSRLAAASHLALGLPFQKELCPYDMAPTSSTTSQLLLGDLLTIALMRHKNFSLDQYALNHPSGQLGKRMTTKVKDLMLMGDQVPLCHADNQLQEILVELSKKRCGCILIVDKTGKLLGIFTDGDLRRSLQQFGKDTMEIAISQLMNPNPLTIQPEVLAWDAMKRMERDRQKRITVFPVVDANSTVLGLLHLHDILQSGL